MHRALWIRFWIRMQEPEIDESRLNDNDPPKLLFLRGKIHQGPRTIIQFELSTRDQKFEWSAMILTPQARTFLQAITRQHSTGMHYAEIELLAEDLRTSKGW